MVLVKWSNSVLLLLTLHLLTVVAVAVVECAFERVSVVFEE